MFILDRIDRELPSFERLEPKFQNFSTKYLLESLMCFFVCLVF